MSDTSSDGARPQSTTRTLKPRFTDGETEARRGDGIPLPAEPVAPPPPSGSRRRFPPLCRPAGAAPPALRPRRLPGRQRSGAGRGAPRGGGLPAALPRGLGGRAGRRGPFPFCSRLCPPFLGARQGERSRGAEQRRAPPPYPAAGLRAAGPAALRDGPLLLTLQLRVSTADLPPPAPSPPSFPPRSPPAHTPLSRFLSTPSSRFMHLFVLCLQAQVSARSAAGFVRPSGPGVAGGGVGLKPRRRREPRWKEPGAGGCTPGAGWGAGHGGPPAHPRTGGSVLPFFFKSHCGSPLPLVWSCFFIRKTK